MISLGESHDKILMLLRTNSRITKHVKQTTDFHRFSPAGHTLCDATRQDKGRGSRIFPRSGLVGTGHWTVCTLAAWLSSIEDSLDH